MARVSHTTGWSLRDGLICLVSLVLVAGVSRSMFAAAPHDLQQQIRGNEGPVIRLNTPLPAARATTAAFSPDGRTLYVGGRDKVVRVWRLHADERFHADPQRTFRVPAGNEGGLIYALAVSPDGKQLVVGGRALMRNSTRFLDRRDGIVMPQESLTAEQRLDLGTLLIFDTANGRVVRHVRACRERVVALAFATGPAAKRHRWLVAAFVEAPNIRHLALIDADSGETLATRRLPGHRFLHRSDPQIVARFTNPQPESLRVGVTWNDNRYYAWAPQNQNELREYKNEYGAACTASASGRLFLCGTRGGVAIRRADGSLREAVRDLNLGRDAKPAALAMLGQSEYVALVARKAGEGVAYGLLVGDALSGKSGAELPIPSREAPVLAAAPHAPFVAVVDNAMRRLLFFRRQKLLRWGRPQPHQIIEDGGKAFHAVAFARRDKALLGLVLRPERNRLPGSRIKKRRTGDLLLDFESGQLRSENGWQVAGPDLRGWSTTLSTDSKTGRSSIRVRRPAGTDVFVSLPNGRVLDFALLPSAARPLLAVALRDGDVPLCLLYDAARGAWRARLTGLQAPVESLAFSPDGRLLAAAAADRTLRVWWVARLAQAEVGHGMLRGVVARDANASVEVVELNQTMFPREVRLLQRRLRPGDRLRAATIGKQRFAIDGAFELAMLAARQRVGSQVTVELSRGGTRREVTLPVGEAVADLVPHFSLFLTREPAGWSWIAWSPSGPFISSGGDVEQQVGFHFNAPHPTQPVEFAAIGQYRRQFQHPHLLKHLAENETPPVGPPRPDPRASFGIHVDDKLLTADANSQVLLRSTARATLSVLISNVEPEDVEQLVLRRPGGTQVALIRQSDPAVWRVAFRPEDWSLKPGVHSFKLYAGLRGQRDLVLLDVTPLVRVQADRPVIRVSSQPDVTSKAAVGKEATARDVTLRVTVAEGTAPQVRLLHRVGMKQSTTNVRLREGVGRVTFRLAEGPNELIVEAQNEAALQGFEELETTRRRYLVRFKMPPPIQLELAGVRVPGSKQLQPITPGQTVRVHADRLEVAGKIDRVAGVRRIKATVTSGGAPPRENPVAVDAQGRFRQTLGLVPGEQRIQLSVVAPEASSQPVAFSAHFQPQVSSVPPRWVEGERLRIAANAKPKMTLAFRSPTATFPFEIAYIVNGVPQHRKRVKDKVQTASDFRATSPPLTLRPGMNQVVARLTNAWGADQRTAAREIYVLQLPEAPRLATPQAVVDQPTLSLDVRVASRLPPQQVHLQVGARKEVRRLQFREVQRGDWKARIEKLALNEGIQTIVARIENADGVSPASRPLRIERRGSKPLPPPPVVEVHSAFGPVVDSANISLRLRVAAPAGLTQLHCRVNRRRVAVPVDSGRKAGSFIEFTTALRLEEDGRLNEVRIVAQDRHGRMSEPRILRMRVAPPPLRFVIRSVLPADGGPPIPTRQLDDGSRITTAAARSAKIQIAGSVQFRAGGGVKPPQFLKVWVNGFLQSNSIAVGDDLSFNADLTLNRKRDNQVVLEAAGFPSHHALLHVAACANPETKQSLKVVIVNVGDEKLTGIEQQLSVLGESQPFRGRVRTESRSGAVVSGSELRGILVAHRFLVDSGPGRALILYFHGAVRNVPKARPRNTALMLLANQVSFDSEDCITSRELEDLIGGARGAHLLLVDTPEPQARSFRGWPRQSRLGVLLARRKAADAVPLSDRVISQIRSLVGKQRPVTLAEVSQRLRTAFDGRTDEPTFSAHLPPTGIGGMLLVGD